MSTVDEEALDGREQRSRRTRAAIVEAWLDLVEEGNTAPTARETADRAGIGLRTVFQHFGDMDDLHATAAFLHFERIQPFLQGLDAGGTFEERLTRFVQHRQRLFERITPIRRAALHRATLGANVGGFLRSADESFAIVAFSVFTGELATEDPVLGATLQHALATSWSWSAWDYLRTSLQLSPADAAEAFAEVGRRMLPATKS